MKILNLIFVISSLGVRGQISNKSGGAQSADTLQKKEATLENRYPSLEKASPKAKVLMPDEWYYSPIDDLAPFGNDNAADTYASFYEWRKNNQSGSPKAFLLAHFKQWNYPNLDLESTDYNTFKSFLQSDQLGSRYLFGMDASIIATALGQLYLEGKIDFDIREFAVKAIKRESLPEILNTWQDLKQTRQKRLNDFKEILDKCK